MEEGQDLQTHVDELEHINYFSTVRKQKDDLTLSIVLSNLFDEELRRKRENGREEEVLKVGNKNFKHYQKAGTSNTNNGNKPIFCYFCKKRNHLMKDCRKPTTIKIKQILSGKLKMMMMKLFYQFKPTRSK